MGRKKKMNVKEKVEVRFRVDADLAERVRAAAEKEGNSVAAFFRSAVVKELSRRAREGGAP